jgi:hypothetical protein
MVSRNVLNACPTCRRRPGLFGYAVYRCETCGRLCCENCVMRGLFGTVCPNCGRRSRFTRVGYTR